MSGEHGHLTGITQMQLKPSCPYPGSGTLAQTGWFSLRGDSPWCNSFDPTERGFGFWFWFLIFFFFLRKKRHFSSSPELGRKHGRVGPPSTTLGGVPPPRFCKVLGSGLSLIFQQGFQVFYFAQNLLAAWRSWQVLAQPPSLPRPLCTADAVTRLLYRACPRECAHCSCLTRPFRACASQQSRRLLSYQRASDRDPRRASSVTPAIEALVAGTGYGEKALPSLCPIPLVTVARGAVPLSSSAEMARSGIGTCSMVLCPEK